MARAARKYQSVTLPPPTSLAATLGPGDPADPGGPAAAAPLTVAVPLLTQLAEYEPPPLPGMSAAAPRVGAGLGVRAFRVAAATGQVPPVPITYDPGRRVWVLLGDYTYGYQGHVLLARDGYAFDLSSVPRPLWWLIAPNELSIVAPLFHDLLYEYRGRLPDDQVTPYRTYTRREADDLFHHLMEVEGVAWWRRNAAYSAVRAAGGVYWAT